MSSQRFTRTHRWHPVKLGLSGVTLAAARTSNWMGVSGANSAMMFFNHSANSAATSLSWYFQATIDNGTTVFRLPTSSISAGVETVRPLFVTQTIAAATYTPYGITWAPFDGDMRVVIGSEASEGGGHTGDASDLATITIDVGWTP